MIRSWWHFKFQLFNQVIETRFHYYLMVKVYLAMILSESYNRFKIHNIFTVLQINVMINNLIEQMKFTLSPHVLINMKSISESNAGPYGIMQKQ